MTDDASSPMPNHKIEKTFLERAISYPYGQKIRQFFYETPAEVIIGVALFGALGGIWRYNHDVVKKGEIPLAFSEVEQITKDFNAKNQPVPPLTAYYAKTNDVCMKVFESNNIAFSKGGDDNKVFAQELEKRIDPTIAEHELVSTYCQQIPKHAMDALQSLDTILRATATLPDIARNLSDSWTERHDDNYHTNVYMVSVPDADGKGSHMETRTEQVYDDTDHYYYFHANAANNAARLLNALVEKYPDIHMKERLAVSSKTHVENEEAMEKSRQRELEGKKLTGSDFLSLANTWANGSTFIKQMPIVYQNYNGLKNITPEYNRAVTTARDVHYNTTSSSHSGPGEYQTANKAGEYSNDAHAAARAVINSIQFTAKEAPALNAKIHEFIDIVLNGKPGDADDVRGELMDMTVKLYQKNFVGGFDVQPFGWGMTVLFTVLGMIAGGAAGAGVDHLVNKLHERSARRKDDDMEGRLRQMKV